MGCSVRKESGEIIGTKINSFMVFGIYTD